MQTFILNDMHNVMLIKSPVNYCQFFDYSGYGCFWISKNVAENSRFDEKSQKWILQKRVYLN